MSCGSGEYVRLMEHYPLVTGAVIRYNLLESFLCF